MEEEEEARRGRQGGAPEGPGAARYRARLPAASGGFCSARMGGLGPGPWGRPVGCFAQHLTPLMELSLRALSPSPPPARLRFLLSIPNPLKFQGEARWSSRP